MKDMSWDDLRFLLAVSRARTMTEAAGVLGVTHGTVSRRLAGLEKRCAGRLFSRGGEGYVPTSMGARLISAAMQMEGATVALERDLLGADGVLSGDLRVSTLTLFVRSLAPMLCEFRSAHPGIRLLIDSGREPVSLDRNEAHVVLRATDQPGPSLVGRCVGRLAFAPYGNPDLLGGEPPWLDWANCFGKRRTAEFLATHCPGKSPVAEFVSFEDMLAAVEAGVGAALLPCLDGDRSERLCRLGPVVEDFSMGVWLLTHATLRSSPRVKAFMSLAALTLKELRPRMEGRLDGPERREPARSA